MKEGGWVVRMEADYYVGLLSPPSSPIPHTVGPTSLLNSRNAVKVWPETYKPCISSSPPCRHLEQNVCSDQHLLDSSGGWGWGGTIPPVGSPECLR